MWGVRPRSGSIGSGSWVVDPLIGFQMGTGLTSLVQVIERGPNRTLQIPVGVTIDTESTIADHASQGFDQHAQLVVDIRS